MAEKMDAGQTDDHKGETPRTSEEELDFSYTQNRELSWLRFNDRVLDEAFDETVPLFERLKFVSIFGSNLDEWFMIRIGGLSDLTLLKHQPKDNKSNETPAEQLQAIFAVLPDYVSKQQRALDQIESKLATRGLERLKIDDMSDADHSAANKFFLQQVAPIISPQIVDPRHPFPNLRNGQLYVTCSLNGPEETGMLGIVEVPSALPRVVELPAAKELWRYTLIEDVIRDHLFELFGEYVPTTSATIRITRNADIDPDGEGVGEEEDYRQHMKRVLKLRQRLQPVRLEIQGALPKELEKFVLAEIGLSKKRVFHVRMPLDLGYVYSLEEHLPADTRATLLYNPFQPQTSPMVDPTRPMREQVDAGDILLFYPYESMNPLLRLIHEASVDDNCIQIKITLYRVAKRSKLCESLIAASENGKDVTVLMELRARFDEQNNIDWAERLEDAGCTVIYGQEGFKVHSKICQIIYHDKGAISRITCLGTGNFNEKTAELYSDFMLLTAHPGIGEDGNLFFRNLSLGNLQGTYHYLGVAPTSLKPLVMSGLDREIEKARASKPASAFMKMNSLTDRDVIDKISEACEAGVHIVMIVRGICCIKAGVPGKTDGLVVRQIVGRFLEHARVYSFGVDADTIYLSSADMMTRNTERRVEIAYPVLDPICRKLVTTYMDLQLADNVKSRQLTADGTWEKIPIKADEPRIDAQAQLEVRACKRATEAADAQSASHKHRSPTSVERAAVRKAPSATRLKASFPTSVPNSKATGVEAPRRGRLQRALGLIGEGFKMLFGGQ
jgi:polyphosphate kinase